MGRATDEFFLVLKNTFALVRLRSNLVFYERPKPKEKGKNPRIKQILNAALDREPLPEASAPKPTSPHTFARATAEFFPQVVS